MTDTGWEQELRNRGYRLTPQRQFVLEAVRRLGHATPDEVGSAVREVAAGVNLSTIYRTLELLEELGLVTHTHLGHGAPTYHAADPDGVRHVHLVCRRCDGVTEVPSAFFDVAVGSLSDRFGFHTDVGHLAIFGVCATCGADDAP